MPYSREGTRAYNIAVAHAENAYAKAVQPFWDAFKSDSSHENAERLRVAQDTYGRTLTEARKRAEREREATFEYGQYDRGTRY